jgi:hypothetical protein
MKLLSFDNIVTEYGTRSWNYLVELSITAIAVQEKLSDENSAKKLDILGAAYRGKFKHPHHLATIFFATAAPSIFGK